MGQGHRGQRLGVVGRDVGAAGERGQRLGGFEQGQAAPRAGPHGQVGMRTCGHHDAPDVVDQRVVDAHVPDGPLQGHDLLAPRNLLHVLDGVFPLQVAQNTPLFLQCGMAQAQLHQEAVHLRLGQRERALVLDGVLRRQDQEGPGQHARHPIGCDLALAHGLQQGRLRARRGAVNLIGQQDVDEGRAGAELEVTPLLVIDGDAGHVVGQ